MTWGLTERSVSRRECVHVVRYKGMPIYVKDSAYNVLKVFKAMSDSRLPNAAKLEVITKILFDNPDDVLKALYPEKVLNHVLWEVCGIDLMGDHRSEEPVFDWDIDAGRIRSSLRMAYGINLDREIEKMSFHELTDYMTCLLESSTETPFQQAIYYRMAKPDPKWNDTFKQDFEKKSRYYALPGSEERAAVQTDKAASAIFDSIWSGLNG